MVKKEFYYDSRDGRSKLHTLRYTPDDLSGVKGVVQIVHGMAEYVERYEEFAGFLTERGFVVTGEDHMGHGKSVGSCCRYGFFCYQDPATVLVRDVHRLKKITQADFPNVPYIIIGHSMGSFITRNYMFRYGTGIDAAIIMGTGMQPKGLLRASKAVAAVQRLFCGGRHESRLLDELAFWGYNRKIENPKTPFDWLSRDADRVEAYVKDPFCGFVFTVNGFRTLFELIYRLYDPENLSRIPKKLPVLMVSGTDDPVGEYGEGVRRAYDSLKGAGLENVSLQLFEGARHELLNETNRDEVMEYLYGWIEKTVGTQSEQKV